MDKPEHVDSEPGLDRQESRRIEFDLLIDAIFRKYGYDFRNYSKASMKRRILRRMTLDNIPSLSAMQERILYDRAFFETVLLDLSINVTEMFRDASFYKALRAKVLPALKNNPFIRIWHAGCSSGEEAYSMAILLMEENLYEKTRIYATDFNEKILQIAKEGIYSLKVIRESSRNYLQAGGKNSFNKYYTAKHEHAILNRELKQNIVFSDHNLAQDTSFGEMNMIVCRNVLIYFNKELQNRVLSLFNESLTAGGYLCLGSKESVRFADCSAGFADVDGENKIYQKK